MYRYNVLKEGYLPDHLSWHRADECLPMMEPSPAAVPGTWPGKCILSESPVVLIYVKTEHPFYTTGLLEQWDDEDGRDKPSWCFDYTPGALGEAAGVPDDKIYWSWLPLAPE